MPSTAIGHQSSPSVAGPRRARSGGEHRTGVRDPARLVAPIRRELAAAWREPLLRNGHFLTVSSVATAAIGLFYWSLAAHHYSTAVVGRSSAVIAAMMLIGGVAQLNLISALVRFVPVAGVRTGRLVVTSYVVAAALAGALGIAFVAVAPRCQATSVSSPRNLDGGGTGRVVRRLGGLRPPGQRPDRAAAGIAGGDGERRLLPHQGGRGRRTGHGPARATASSCHGGSAWSWRWPAPTCTCSAGPCPAAAARGHRPRPCPCAWSPASPDLTTSGACAGWQSLTAHTVGRPRLGRGQRDGLLRNRLAVRDRPLRLERQHGRIAHGRDGQRPVGPGPDDGVGWCDHSLLPLGAAVAVIEVGAPSSSGSSGRPTPGTPPGFCDCWLWLPYPTW